ncbi:MAG: hypothetical protein ABI324_28010 [Ktedonobacteraceae bacterium]
MNLFNNGKTAEENAVDFVIECDEAGIDGQDDYDMSQKRWEASQQDEHTVTFLFIDGQYQRTIR